MNGLSLQSVARALGGEVSNDQVSAPGPGHRPKDRSTTVRLAPGLADGFVVFSHADDDPLRCKDYVRSRLGMPPFTPRSKAGPSPVDNMNARAQEADQSRDGPGRIVALYDYVDEHGVLIRQAVRFEPKEFRQRRPDPDKPGGWLWKVTGARNVPYRLLELMASGSAPVFVVEGEKDADRLNAAGLTATTSIAGAGKWTADLDPHFTGRVVFVLADNDEPGAKHSAQVAEHLTPIAAEVRVVALPGLPEKGDVSDWLDAGNDPAALLELCRTFPTFKAAAGERQGTSKRQHQRREQNDNRPVIRVVAGEIAGIVDEAGDALIAHGGLYQRSNLIVFLGDAPIITADRREVGAQRIFERGEHALAEDLAMAACVERYDERRKAWAVTNPPSWIVKTLMQRTGRMRFPVLTGVIGAPTLRPDGSLLAEPGYDNATGLFLDLRGTAFPAIRPDPSKQDAASALAFLDELVAGFPFVSEVDRSVALSGILTACVRQSLATAPLHAYGAPVPGSGKSKLVDIASAIATGREAGVIAQGKTEEETEKRLGSLFRAGDPVVAIDNCEAPLGGEFLCMALTQSTARVRILGLSEAPEFSTRAFMAATGNGLAVVGDMARRTLMCSLDPRMERPELRTFTFEPVARVKADRGRYVAAALTVLLAYQHAGRPTQAVPLGSFEEWSGLVRNALLWLGRADAVTSMEKARSSDPRLDELSAVMTQWRAVIGTDRVSVRELIERATEQSGGAFDIKAHFEHPDFREALLAVAGMGGAVNSKRLGRWITSHTRRIVNGCSVDQMGLIDGVMPIGSSARSRRRRPIVLTRISEMRSGSGLVAYRGSFTATLYNMSCAGACPLKSKTLRVGWLKKIYFIPLTH